MLKLIRISRCNFCTKVTAQTVLATNDMHNHVENFEKIKANMACKRYSKNSIHKQVYVRINKEHIKAVNSLLEKYNIDTTTIKADKRIFNETEWNIEKKILLFKEMGLKRITTSNIINFMSQMNLSVSLYKAYLGLPAEMNLSEKLLSTISSSKINPHALNNLNETMLMKFYYGEVLNYYLRKELGLTKEQSKYILYKKYTPIMYNSFKLLERLLKIMKDNYNFSTSLIMKNFFWLFGHHPDHGLAVLKMVQDNYKDLNVHKILLRFPKLLNYDLKELKILLLHMKNYNITTQMIQSAPEIFHLNASEFKGRMDSTLSNPFTLVYQKHPRFLLLIKDYHITLPRIQYLQEKNFKYATIYTLTTFHNYMKHLTTVRKLNKANLISFLELHFDDNIVNELFARLQKHPYYSCATLVQMNETISYLKEVFPKLAIYKHIYAVLYSVSDLKAAYEEIMKDPELSKLSPQHILSMCLYKIEKMCHFSGSGVLVPNKYSESLKRDVNHVKNEEEKKEE